MKTLSRIEMILIVKKPIVKKPIVKKPIVMKPIEMIPIEMMRVPKEWDNWVFMLTRLKMLSKPKSFNTRKKEILNSFELMFGEI